MAGVQRCDRLVAAGLGLVVALVLVPFVGVPGRAGAEPPVRQDPALFVVADHRLSDAEVHRLVAGTGATLSLPVDVGRVRLGAGTTESPDPDAPDAPDEAGETDAIAVDPATFPAVAPAGTAEVAELWRRLAAGRPALAHTVAAALGVTVGGSVRVRSGGRWWSQPVAALATTGLPGVGVLVGRSSVLAATLRDRAGLVLVVPGRVDPVVLAALARQAVPGVDARPLGTAPVTDPPGGAPSSASPTPVASPRPGSPEPAPPTSSPSPAAPATQPAATATQPVATGAGAAAWVRPAPGPITQGFGPRSPGGRHPGIDIGAPLGAPVLAAAAGTVLYAGPASGFGNEIVLQHPGGVRTVYGHMRVLLVRAGPVAAGQEIALVGSEGNSTGPHLHFEVHVGGTRVDPQSWLRSHGVP